MVERRTELSPLPRATGVSTRVMELLRAWGLESEILEGAVDVEWLGWMGDTLAAPQGTGLQVGFPTREQSAREIRRVLKPGGRVLAVTEQVLAAMSPEIAELIDTLHEPMSADDSKAVWDRYRSALS